MAKVFRFHQGQDISGWEQTSPLAPNEISQIEDPDGLSPIRQITSIPSPFARVDLVLTAFLEVTKSGNVHGNNIFYKMVSDALDIGQIFFNLDICEDVKIVAWDKNSDLEKLRTSENIHHKHLGETLKLFLDQDSSAYNFDKLNRLFILSYNKENDDLRVLGGTSPCTLFFSASNDLEKIYKKNFGRDTLFNNDYRPLYQREPDYIKYLYSLRASSPVKFREYFNSFSDYLDMNYGLLSDELKSVITGMDEEYTRRNFSMLTTGKDGDYAEVNGISLYRNLIDKNKIESESDFVIRSDVYDGLKPLVLPNSKTTAGLRYIWEEWSPDHAAPFHDKEPVLDNRSLPYIGIQYPYLTVSDFLQPYIVRLEFPMNGNRYFNGNPSDNLLNEDYCFLPPLKKEFFRFFRKEDLKRYHANQVPFFQMNQLAGGTIEVVLRIPVRNGFTTFTRKYENQGQYALPEKPSEEKNQGFIVDHSIDMGIFPFLEFSGPGDAPFYRIGIADKDNQPVRMSNNFSLNFYDQENPAKKIENARIVNKSEKTGADAGFDIYIVGNKFDFIEIEINPGHYNALVIPWFRKETGTNQFTFAVDFGTTYSHIEYRRNGESPKPLEINDVNSRQIEKLHHPSYESNISPEFREIFVFNLIPDLIGSTSEYFFPIRTAVAEKTSLDKFSEAYALADLNIPFTYEKKPAKRYQRINTELKWQSIHGDDRPKRRIEAFVENFMMIIKAFVILNQGDVSKTRMIWLYPASMNRSRRDLLADIWNRNLKKYMPSVTEEPVAMSESVAPYYYFRSSQDASSYDQPAVSIDIGGETTDVVFFRNNKPAMMTSFRFAGNALFSSADNVSADNNGFVKAFNKVIEGHLKSTDSPDLVKVFEEINSSRNARDVVNFFFSLENNLKIREKSTISFLNMLQNSKDFRIVVLLFYTAIIYHVATIFKQKEFELPRHISFSGTASRLLKVITTSNDTLKNYTMRIFEMACGRIYHSDGLTIHRDEINPKEVTCKGALIQNKESTDLSGIRYIHYGIGDLSYPRQKIRYNEIDDKMKNSVIDEYNNFLEFFIALGRDVDLSNTFDIPDNSLNKYLAELRRDVKNLLSARIAETFDNEESEEQLLEESLFFLPLAGTIKKLISKIGSDLQ